MKKINIDGVSYVMENSIPKINTEYTNPDVSNGLELSHCLGKEVTLFCLNYFYHGTIHRCDARGVGLKNASIVYETGDFEERGFKDAQSVCSEILFVNKEAIESYAILDNKND